MIDPVHIPAKVVAGEGDGAVTFVAEEDIIEPVIVPTQAVVADEAKKVVAVEEINPDHVLANVMAVEVKNLNSGRKSRYHFPSYLYLSLSLFYIKMFGGGERYDLYVPADCWRRGHG